MGGGGALYSPSFSPYNPNELFISCDMSELFHSTDLGASWKVEDFRQIMGGNVTGNVQFTGTPSTLYTIDNRNDAPRPVRSIDGGTTWHPINDPTDGGAFYLYADIGNADRVLVTDYDHLYFSSDGGNNFTRKFTGSPSAGLHIGGAFFDGANIYVGTNAGMLVSTDGGATFSVSNIGGIPQGEAIVSFAGAKQNGTVRFYCVTLGTDDVYAGLTGAEYWNYRSIYTLTVGQGTWVEKNSGIPIGENPFFVAMAQNNIDVAYVAGGSFNSTPIVYKTVDGGNNWTSVLTTQLNGNVKTGWSGYGGDREWTYGEYALGFAVSPVDPQKVAITDLGFIHLTTDGGLGWKQAYLASGDQNPAGSSTPRGRAYHGIGLENTTCWRVAWADSSRMIGCYSDIRGTISSDAGATWSQNYTGHTYNTMYHALYSPALNTLYAATSSVHDMYQSTTLTDARIDDGRGQVLFSANKGSTWQLLHDFGKPVIWLALDPKNPNRIYASVINSTDGGIYTSANINLGAASTWTKLAAPPRTEGHPLTIQVLDDGTLLCSYSGRRDANGFTNSSGVFVSTDGGGSWVDRSASQMHYWTKDVVVDPHDSTQSTWYAGVFSGWGGAPNGLGGLYRTTNRGTTWTRINDLDRVTSCTVNPANPNEAYLTTEVDGLWYTNDLRSATPAFSQVASYPFRQPERVFYNPYRKGEVWVTSFGNGLRRGFVPPPATPPLAPVLRYPANDSVGVPTSWHLVWQTTPGAATYRVQISTSPDFATTALDRSGLAAPSEGFEGLNEQTKYYWRVDASNGAGTSPWSEVWSFTTGKNDAPVPPPVPALVSPANDSTGVPIARSLWWTSAAGALTYRVQLSTSPDFSTTVLDKSGLTTTTQAFTGLANDTKYYWRVSARNDAGTSPWSASWSFTTASADAPIPPPAPALISPADDSVDVPRSRTLFWSALPNATSYRVQLSTSPDFTTTVLDQSALADPFAPFADLAAQRRYYWRVSASNAAGTGPWSAVWSFVTAGVTAVDEHGTKLPTKLDLK
jgi:photosystem II stability/assembly factor-like uncharacterized protein